MNAQLITITQRTVGAGQVQTVNARELHAFLEVGKDFSTWLKSRIDQYDFVKEVDFVEVFPKTGENSAAGRPAKEYALTLGMAKELSMVERNARGKQARNERHYMIICVNLILLAIVLLPIPVLLFLCVEYVCRKTTGSGFSAQAWGVVMFCSACVTTSSLLHNGAKVCRDTQTMTTQTLVCSN